MNYSILKSEITNDPIGLGYSGKNDQQIADLLNANIRIFANDEIWLADHLPTIKRMVDIVNLNRRLQ